MITPGTFTHSNSTRIHCHTILVLMALALAVAALLAFAPKAFATTEAADGEAASDLAAAAMAAQSDYEQQDRNNAYFLKLQDYIAQYGAPSIGSRSNGITELSGVCLAVLQDYDRDGKDELLVAYYDRSRVPSSANSSLNYAPAYVYEVWSYENGVVQVIFQHTAQWTNGGLAYVPMGCSYEPFPRDGSLNYSGAYLYHETIAYASGVDSTQTYEIKAKRGSSFTTLTTMAASGVYTANLRYSIDGVPCSRDEANAYIDSRIGEHSQTSYSMMTTSSATQGTLPSDVLAITNNTIDSLRITEVHGRPAQALYRLYNPNSYEHFYTADEAERAHLMSLGWRYESVGWVAPKGFGTPVYRLYNPNNGGDHHYTMEASERDMLIAAGWRNEDVGWYSASVADGVSVFREYNSNELARNHNYTKNHGEHTHLVDLGWHDEGIAWYGVL